MRGARGSQRPAAWNHPPPKLSDALLVLIAMAALVPGHSRACAATRVRRQGNGPVSRLRRHLQLRVVTYNIRSCEGLDGHFRCDRIADILRKINADVIALQEVRAEQAAEIARRLGYNVFFGHADTVHGYNFGNAILTRLTIRQSRIYPIGVPGRQQRACLRADLGWPAGNQTLHVFTVHLGLGVAERREQGKLLASPLILEDPAIQNEPRILLGDFNEKFNHQDVNRQLKPLLQIDWEEELARTVAFRRSGPHLCQQRCEASFRCDLPLERCADRFRSRPLVAILELEREAN